MLPRCIYIRNQESNCRTSLKAVDFFVFDSNVLIDFTCTKDTGDYSGDYQDFVHIILLWSSCLAPGVHLTVDQR